MPAKTVDNTEKKTQHRIWNKTGHSDPKKKLVKNPSISEENILPENSGRKRKNLYYKDVQYVDGELSKQNIVKGKSKSNNTLEKREKAKITKSKKLSEKKEEKKEELVEKTPKKAKKTKAPKKEKKEKKEEEKKEAEEPEKMAVEKEEEQPPASPNRRRRTEKKEEEKKPEEKESVVVAELKKLGCTKKDVPPKLKCGRCNVPEFIRKFLEYLPQQPLDSAKHEVTINKWGLETPDVKKLKAYKTHQNSCVLGMGEGHLFCEMKQEPTDDGDFDIFLGFEVLVENGVETEPEIVEGPFKMSAFLKTLKPITEKKD